MIERDSRHAPEPGPRYTAEDSGGRSNLWDWSLRLLLLSVILSLAVHSLADPDLWGHLLFGQRMLEMGQVTRVDPYSFLSHPEWINHEWLAEVIFAGAWNAGGDTGLLLFKAALVLVVLGAIYRHFRREQGLDVFRAGLVVSILVLPLIVRTGTIRPHLFTLLLFTATVLILKRIETGEPRAAWLLPAVIALWINFHGGVLAGLAVVLLWTAGDGIGELLRTRRLASLFEGKRKHVLGGVAACVPALLVNPYGPDLPLFLFRTATVDRPFITEWQPLDVTSIIGGVYLVILALVGISLLRSDRKIHPGAVAVIPALALLPFTAVRHLSLFSIGAILLAAPQIADTLRPSGPRSAPSHRAFRLPLIGVMLAGAVVMLFRIPEELSCIPVPETYPVETVSLLEDSGAEGNLVVTFNWGEYAIWHLHDRMQVSMDGRRETVYPDSIYDSNFDLTYGRDDWDRVLETPPVNVALVHSHLAADNLLSLKPGWAVAYRDSVQALHVREGSRQAGLIAAAEVTRRHPVRADGSGGGSDRPGEGMEDDGEARLCFP